MSRIREPEFLVCRECETPCYTFEWHYERETVIEALCQCCGNDQLEEFDTDEEFLDEE
jgi:hypothetical protein